MRVGLVWGGGAGGSEQVFPMPTPCTLIHLTVGAVLMASLWWLRLKKSPQLNERLVNNVRAPPIALRPRPPHRLSLRA
jgi:hypothetical protein